MAYVSKEDKAILSIDIKKILKKYNMKGTISISNMSTLIIKLSKGELDLVEARNTHIKNRYLNDSNAPYMNTANWSINTDWIEDTYKDTPKVCNFLTELKSAMEGKDFFDKSDLMTDYHHVSHYIDIKVGGTKDYICTK